MEDVKGAHWRLAWSVWGHRKQTRTWGWDERLSLHFVCGSQNHLVCAASCASSVGKVPVVDEFISRADSLVDRPYGNWLPLQCPSGPPC